MTTEKSKLTKDQATTGQTAYQQEPPPTPQQAAIDEIKNLFQEATKQIREAPSPPTLVGGALAAAKAYEVIKNALRTPTKAIGQLNTMASPTDQASNSAS